MMQISLMQRRKPKTNPKLRRIADSDEFPMKREEGRERGDTTGL